MKPSFIFKESVFTKSINRINANYKRISLLEKQIETDEKKAIQLLKKNILNSASSAVQKFLKIKISEAGIYVLINHLTYRFVQLGKGGGSSFAVNNSDLKKIGILSKGDVTKTLKEINLTLRGFCKFEYVRTNEHTKEIFFQYSF